MIAGSSSDLLSDDSQSVSGRSIGLIEGSSSKESELESASELLSSNNDDTTRTSPVRRNRRDDDDSSLFVF
jgi:hypothetical protein